VQSAGRLIAGLAVLSGAGNVYAQETIELPEVRVEADADASMASSSAEDARAGAPADGGDWLLSIPGVSGVRMGSHGLDPVIRGQKQTQLNVLLDGAFVHGGCPNRMDPPSSYASAETYDRVVVYQGVQTLIYGPGGPGGTVLFERDPPRFAPGKTVTGRLQAGGVSNGNAWDAAADVAAGSEHAYARAILSAKAAGNYTDGDGQEVRSGYKERDAIADFGYRPDGDSLLKLSLESTRARDVLYAGAGMDAPVSDNDTVKLSYEKTAAVGPFAAVKAELYQSAVHHVMDNYSLRPVGAMYMRVPSESDTLGGRFSGDLSLGGGVLTLGADLQRNLRDATRYGGMSADPTMINSYLWPDVRIRQVGVFAEYAGQWSTASRYTAGLRLDRVDTSAAKAALDPMGAPVSANDLYSHYYGTTARDHGENNLGLLLRTEHDLTGSDTTVYAGLSSTARTADATERYIASWNATPSMQWVGNPDLKPERHNQLELGARWKQARLSVDGSVYYDRVHDYILRDRAHLVADNATIYRNVAARLYGADMEMKYRWSERWSARLTLAYVNATNTSDGRPIAQIPPLEGTLSLDHRRRDWTLGGAIRFAARQTRVDDDPLTGSGLDVGQTPGFAVLDLYGSRRLGRDGQLRFGIDNVFDRAYAQHLNKANAFDVTQVRVKEPGRSVWMKLSMRF
jgi:iron complex outermembrane receptor protein